MHAGALAANVVCFVKTKVPLINSIGFPSLEVEVPPADGVVVSLLVKGDMDGDIMLVIIR